MRPQANLQLIYVTDIQRSSAFYEMLFSLKPMFSSPRYVAFAADEHAQALFALWSGGNAPDAAAPRYSEIGIMLGSDAEVDNLYQQWQCNDTIDIIQPPYTEVFGRTFLVRDPDGHIIRVCKRD